MLHRGIRLLARIKTKRANAVFAGVVDLSQPEGVGMGPIYLLYYG